LQVNNFLSTAAGPFDDTERRALALALIEMQGVADWSKKSQFLFVPNESETKQSTSERPTWIFVWGLIGLNP
jgi:hypothetical protein